MLTIYNLSKTYRGGIAALKNIDLDLGKGIFGLLGPNGAGKSTLMRTLATLQEPDSGRIVFKGTDIVEHPAAIRQVLGYLPQEFGVYPRLSAVALLDHLAVLKGVHDRKARHEQIDRLLHQTRLYDDRNRAVSTYSGGMRQRFGIAQALLGSPEILIIDEPTAGLDPEERYRFQDLLSELGEEMVLLLSTHIVEDVSDLCSRVAILADGQVVLEGEPDRLVARLDGKIWRKTIEKGALAAHRAAFPVISSRLVRGRTQIHVLSDAAPTSDFERQMPDLKDVYFAALRDGPASGGNRNAKHLASAGAN